MVRTWCLLVINIESDAPGLKVTERQWPQSWGPNYIYMILSISICFSVYGEYYLKLSSVGLLFSLANSDLLVFLRRNIDFG